MAAMNIVTVTLIVIAVVRVVAGCSTSKLHLLPCHGHTVSIAAAVELRRLFPGVTDNAQARECARAIAGWKLLRNQSCECDRWWPPS
jgi:hypothetical protein